AAFDPDDDVDALIFEGEREAVDGGAQSHGILQERRDVVEQNPGFRKVRDVTNFLFERVRSHLIMKPVSRPPGMMCSTSTCSTRAPGGPCRMDRSNRVIASDSPSA